MELLEAIQTAQRNMQTLLYSAGAVLAVVLLLITLAKFWQEKKALDLQDESEDNTSIVERQRARFRRDDAA